MEYYNNDIKQEFLDDKTSKAAFKTLFNQLNDLQIKNNEDLYDLPGDMIATELVKKSNMHSLGSLRSQYAKAIQYKEWAFMKGYIDEQSVPFMHEHIDLKSIFLTNQSLSIFRTPKELADFLKQKLSYGILDRTTTDDLLKTYYCLAYQGIHPDVILSIKTSDVIVSQNNMAILTPKETVVVYREFYNMIAHVLYNRTYENLSPKSAVVLKMNDFLINKGDDFTQQHLKKLLSSAANKKFNKGEIRINDIYIMGCIYKIKQTSDHQDIPYDQLRLEIFGKNKVNPLTKEKVYRYYEIW